MPALGMDGPPRATVGQGHQSIFHTDTLGRRKWPKAKWILRINKVSKNTVVSFVYQSQQNDIKILLQNSI